MIQIDIEGKMSIDAALKKYKYKYDKLRIIKELNERKTFQEKKRSPKRCINKS